MELGAGRRAWPEKVIWTNFPSPLHLAPDEEIEAYCRAEGIPLVGKLPYDTVFTEAMVQGQPVTSYRPDGPMSRALVDVWRRVKESLYAGSG